MKKFIQVFAGGVLAAGVALAAFYYMLPWKEMAASKLQAALEEKGFPGVHLRFSEIGLHGATVDTLSLGGTESPLVLKDVVIRYSPRELWDRNLQALTLSGVSLEIRKTDGEWNVHLAALQGSAAARPATGRALLDGLAELTAELGLERTLRDVGVREDDLPMLARDAMQVQRLLVNNPRDVTYDDALAIYRQAL